MTIELRKFVTSDLRVVLSAANSTLQMGLLDRLLSVFVRLEYHNNVYIYYYLQVDLNALIVVTEGAIKDHLKLADDLLLDLLLGTFSLSHLSELSVI